MLLRTFCGLCRGERCGTGGGAGTSGTGDAALTAAGGIALDMMLGVDSAPPRKVGVKRLATIG